MAKAKAVASLLKFFHSFLRASIILILVLPAIWLLAFGPRAIDRPPKDRVIVDYWEKWTGVEGQGIQEIVDEFNKTIGERDRIFVRCLSTSGVEQKTLVAAAAGVPPDIAGLYDWNVAEYAARDALEPLDEMAAADGTITQQTYKKVFWDKCHYDGHLYALISTGYDYALYVNTSKMLAAGLDPSKPPGTIAELDAYGEKMQVIEPSGHIKVAGYLPFEPGWTLADTPFWFGGSWWDEKTQRFTFTDPRVIEAFKWVQSYSNRLGANAVSTYTSGVGNFDSPQNAFMSQTMAMETQGTFFANIIQAHAPALAGHWAVYPSPAVNAALTDVTSCAADVFVIPRGALHPHEAFKFMAYVSRQDVHEKLCNLHCKISALAKVSDDFLSHHRNPFIRVFEKLARSPNARADPDVPIMPEVNDEIANLMDRLRLLHVTPEVGLTEVQQTLQDKLDLFNEEQRLRAHQQ